MNALTLAERAALGAFLLDPTAVDATAAWLRPSDFADPWHREVYREIRAQAVAGRPTGPQPVGAALLDRLGPTRADIARIADLLRFTPPHPDPRAYAVMVLEAALRREVTGQGLFLRAGALAAVLEGSARPAHTVSIAVDASLVAAEARWQAATGERPSSSARTPRAVRRLGTATGSTPGGREQALGADRLLAAHPQSGTAEVSEHEAALVAALIAHPRELGSVRGWLQPDAMRNRAWRSTYEALIRLADHGRPIDAVTVAWETQRASRDAGRGPKPDALSTWVDAALATSPAHLARIVAGDHLRLTADTAATDLRASAANPGMQLRLVIDAGHTAAADVRAAAAPLGAGADARRTGTPSLVRVQPTREFGPVAG